MIASVEKRWLIYALGGGLGHLTRTLSLARTALRGDSAIHVDLITNCSYLDADALQVEMGPRFQPHWLRADLGKARTVERVCGLLSSIPFDTLVVDTFPRGLGGELGKLLPRISRTKVLIQRNLTPEYAERASVQTAIQHYHLVLVPGESVDHLRHANVVRTEPWLLRDSDELPSAEIAARKLAVTSEQLPTIVVSGCGRPDEQAAWLELYQTLQARAGDKANIRYVTPSCAPRIWPLLDALPAIDLLVGAGGYNTVSETRATGTPLLAIAQPRLYDRQALRLRPEEQASSLNDLLQRAVAWIDRWRPPRRTTRSPVYCNGTQQAVQAIESLSKAER